MADLKVHVTNNSDDNISGAVVTVDDASISCTTGSAGGCTLNDVLLGIINYTVTHEDYNVKTGSYEVTGEENEILEIILEE